MKTALDLINEVILECDALISDDLMLATGYKSMKEAFIGSVTTRNLIVRMFIDKCGGDCDKAAKLVQEWHKA